MGPKMCEPLKFYCKPLSVIQIRRSNRDNLGIISQILNIFCDSSLEPSRRDGSNEGSQHMFSLRTRKIIFELSSIPPLIWGSALLSVVGNLYLFSPYKVTKQSTVVTTASSKIETYTKVKPFSQSETTINYGPYEDKEAYSEVSQ